MTEEHERLLVLAGAWAALLVLGLETLFLGWLRRQRSPKALPGLTILLITGAGAGLILALLLALLGAPARWIGLSLALAGLAHGADLFRRLARIDRDQG